MTTRPVERERYADAALRQLNQDKMNRMRVRMEEAAELEALRDPDPPEIQAINRITAEASWLAERNSLFAAARSAASHFAVLPLEAGGTTPVLPAQEATRDLKRLLDWWQTYPTANVGIVAGRLSGVIVLRLSGEDGRQTLRQLATVRYHDPDEDRTYEELRELAAEVVSIGKPGKPVVGTNVRSLGWGRRNQQRIVQEILDEQRPAIQVRYLLMAYPSERSGENTREYKARQLGDGLSLLGDGEVIPFAGRLLDGAVIQAPTMYPPEVPPWFAAKFGKVSSKLGPGRRK